MKRLSSIFRHIRYTTGATQRQMAECIGISEFRLSRIENERSALKAEHLAKLYHAKFINEQDVFGVLKVLGDNS